MSSRKQRNKKFMKAQAIDVVPIGKSSVFLELEDAVVNAAVKEPDIRPGSVNVVLTANDLLDDSSSPNAQTWPACADLGGVEMEPDEGNRDEDDEDEEEVKKGDSTVKSHIPFYFEKAPAKSNSKKYGPLVSRHDIAFMPSDSRLMSMWKGKSHLVFGIGGHLRTVVDWYLVRHRDEAAVSGWLPVSDPARPAVPLWIEFTAVFGEEKVEPGTPLQRLNDSLVPWKYMLNSNRVGNDVNTQFFCARMGHLVNFGLPFLFCVA